MKKYFINLFAYLLLTINSQAQVNPIDSATVWDMWMTWNPVYFQTAVQNNPFVQNGTSGGWIFWQNGRVQSMNSMNNYIQSGTLPSTIGNLSELTFIDLRVNPNLTGPIPPELGLLTNLQKLLISACGFSGAIPSELGNLSNLNLLNFGNPGITGIIPQSFQNLNKLTDFNLGSSDVKGNLPGYFGLLDSIQTIWCYNNPSFGGILTDSLCLSQTLGNLIIVKNAFFGQLPPCIGTIPTLGGLDISHNHFTDSIPQSLFPSASGIMELTADSNDLTSLPFIPQPQPLPPPLYIQYFRVIDVRWNKLQFGSFENTYLNGCSYCIETIAPQDSVWSLLDTTVLINTAVSLNSTVTGQYNTYYWYKNGVLVDSTTNGLLVIPNIQHSDSGVYTCNITNQYITPAYNLILNRNPITLHVADSLNTVVITNINLQPEVFPNPFNQTLTIQLNPITIGSQLNGQTTFSIINTIGKTVMQAKTLAGEYVFNTEKLPSGLYLLKAETGRTVATFKVRKE